MESITFIFIILNLGFLTYILNHIKTKKRIHNFVELIFVLIYMVLTIILIFPNILNFVEDILNIPSALNLMIYSSIFLAYLFIYSLYGRIETQREEITKLNRELALIGNGKKKK
jgi:hypothetical protein